MQLRKMTETLWHQNNNLTISNSEWYILDKIYNQETMISNVTKKVNITRQATHKIIKSLAAKDLVIIYNIENNKRDKWIKLTPIGTQYYENYSLIKSQVERTIEDTIGKEQLLLLKNLLQLDWLPDE